MTLLDTLQALQEGATWLLLIIILSFIISRIGDITEH